MDQRIFHETDRYLECDLNAHQLKTDKKGITARYIKKYNQYIRSIYIGICIITITYFMGYLPDSIHQYAHDARGDEALTNFIAILYTKTQ